MSGLCLIKYLRMFQRSAATVMRFATMRASASTVLPLRLPM